MAVVKDIKFPSVLFASIKKYGEDFYSGKIPIPCDDTCPENCDGKHGNYKLPTEKEWNDLEGNT
jgi:hypothetical protein